MHLAGRDFYYTSECQTLRDMVWISPEAWNHPSKELVCQLVEDNMLEIIPADLNA